MKKLITATLLLIGLAHSVKANLGDTETDIYKRYGKIQSPPVSMTNKDVTFYFKYKDYVVTVTLIEGQSHRETFTKQDNKPFTETEIQALLNANANGRKWEMMTDNKDVKIWVLEAHGAFAGYYKAHPYLSIETHGMMEFNEGVKALREKQQRELRESNQKAPSP